MGFLQRMFGAARPLLRKGITVSPNSPTLKKIFGWGDDTALVSPYGQLPIIYAAIRAVGKVLSQTPIKVMRGQTEVDDGDQVARLFKTPNSMQSEYEFKEGTATNLQVKGNAFWVKDEQEVRGVPIALYCWPASYFVPHYDGNGRWDGWTVRRDGERFLPPERVVHISVYNPNDELLGMAPLDVLKMTYKSMWDAMVYNKKFFENDGTPPIIYKAQNPLSDQYREAFKKDLIERRRGVAHAHEAQLVEGMDVTTLGFTQKDIQFLDLLKFAHEEVLMVFGVSKTQVSKYEDVNYATALSQDKVFITNTCIPMMRQIEAAVNGQWLNALGYTLRFDERANEAMTYLAAEEAAKVVSISNAGLITVNEARGMLGLEPVEWGDEEPAGPVSSLPPFLPQPEQPKKPEPKPAAEEEEEPKRKDISDAIGKARRLNTWNALNNMIKPVELRCAKAVRGYFYGVEKKLLGPAMKDLVQKDVAGPDIDGAFDDDKLYNIMTSYLGQSVGVGYGTMGIGAVNIEDPRVAEYLASRVQYMRGVNDTAKEALKEKLRAVLLQAMEDKLTEEQRAEAIRAALKGEFASLKSRARMIARTEVHGAFADGRWTACEELAPTEIEWISSRDPFVRDSHERLDGKRVAFGQTFSNGCRFPLDPHGGPSEVINCRCNFQVHF